MPTSTALLALAMVAVTLGGPCLIPVLRDPAQDRDTKKTVIKWAFEKLVSPAMTYDSFVKLLSAEPLERAGIRGVLPQEKTWLLSHGMVNDHATMDNTRLVSISRLLRVLTDKGFPLHVLGSLQAIIAKSWRYVPPPLLDAFPRETPNKDWAALGFKRGSSYRLQLGSCPGVAHELAEVRIRRGNGSTG